MGNRRMVFGINGLSVGVRGLLRCLLAVPVTGCSLRGHALDPTGIEMPEPEGIRVCEVKSK